MPPTPPATLSLPAVPPLRPRGLAGLSRGPTWRQIGAAAGALVTVVGTLKVVIPLIAAMSTFPAEVRRTAAAAESATKATNDLVVIVRDVQTGQQQLRRDVDEQRNGTAALTGRVTALEAETAGQRTLNQEQTRQMTVFDERQSDFERALRGRLR